MSVATPRSNRFPLRLAQVSRLPQSGGDKALHRSGQSVTPVGLGLDSQGVRLQLVQRLRKGGVSHCGVLDAMSAVCRHDFLDSALAAQAYEDTSLPIGHGQTISKPSVIARMIELLFEGEGARKSASLGRVLEIGTGCGYQAAVISLLSINLVSIERIKALHDRAAVRLAGIRRDNIRLVFGDGMFGHPPNAPYDSIIAAAGGEHLPAAWLEQLAPFGRLVVPSRQPGSDRQVLVVVDRNEQGVRQSLHEAVNFVPLIPGVVV
ncbi:MAG: protein-L-isoaspartate(D-aspartate) O-methyltransferase [Burkholderiales bacterium]|jgi:protein-L-isoaspartate(D-aspartate) O-methyltransferase|nr:protein-L-isoaspartate(D-aspartate) O-methyltransferase [Burkholderiales bacterium]